MSVRFVNNNSSNNTDVVAKTFPSVSPPPLMPWVRNPSWPPCEANSGDNRVRGLYAVFPSGSNFIAMIATDAYTVDYGDGTTTNYATGVQANYEYDYNDANLVGTEAPVTFTDSTDTVNRTAHGYTNGMQVQFFNITTTTGIVNAQIYLVINATTDTFQVSDTSGGSAIALTNDGTGQLLPYRIATVTITPQGGSNLTSVSTNVRHNQASLQAYSTGWLDLAIASSTITSFGIGAASLAVRQNNLKSIKVNQVGAFTNFSDFCRNLTALQNIEINNAINIVLMLNMFFGCTSLQTVPLFNTANVTNMTNMFASCTSLQTVPLFNTASVGSMGGMFGNCTSLQTVPLFNTAANTSMQQMFDTCTSLQTVPLFNTASVGNMQNAFRNCTTLKTVPAFNLASATNMIGVFLGCTTLQTVPLFNIRTASAVDMSTMFNGCTTLKTVPLFNTVAVTNMSSMFQSCTTLQTVPLFNTSVVTATGGMFNGCITLSSVPALITTAVTSSANFVNMFNNCQSLARIEAKNFRFTFSVLNCKLSATSLNEIYTNLPVAVGQTITVTGNYGTTGDDPTIAIAKGWTVTG